MSSSFVDLDRRHVWHPFTQEQTAPDPIPIVRGEGAYLETAAGERLLDLISSWWVNLHGHAQPQIAAAVAAQAQRLEQVIFAGFTHEPAVSLATRLTALLPDDLDRVFYSDDGSTAVEVALKIAVQYWRNQGRQRRRILAFDGGYHGDTVGAMSVGRGSGFFEAFTPLLFEVERLPYPHTWADDPDLAGKEATALEALERALVPAGEPVAALIMEPLVQGAAGMRMCRPEFVRAVAERVRRAGALLIFDEVMTGFGRTGELFAARGVGVTPDLICLSKGLTGGFLPLSVTVAREAVYQAFLAEDFDRAFTHGHSFTANPLGCAAALASLELTTAEATRQRIGAIAAVHRAELPVLARHARVRRVRQCGTVAAFDVVGGGEGYTAEIGQRLKADFLRQGLLLRPLGNVLYLMPPYCLEPSELRQAYAVIAGVLDAL